LLQFDLAFKHLLMWPESDRESLNHQRLKVPVVQVLIGLWIGLAGLWELIKKAESSGVTDSAALLDRTP